MGAFTLCLWESSSSAVGVVSNVVTTVRAARLQNNLIMRPECGPIRSATSRDFPFPGWGSPSSGPDLGGPPFSGTPGGYRSPNGMTNDELADRLRDLHDFLVIAGYPEDHATRYLHIARALQKMPESVSEMRREGRLKELPGVGPLVQTYIKQILDDGVSEKELEFRSVAPPTVLELVRIPGLGAKTARRLFAEFGVHSLASLKIALDEGRLDGQPGIGPKSLASWKEATS